MLKELKGLFRIAILEYKNPFLWVLMCVLPVGVSLFMVALLSAETPLHLPVGIVRKGEYSRLFDKISYAIESNPVMHVQSICLSLDECAVKMRQGEIYAIILLDPHLESSALRNESPLIPVYTNAQSLLMNNILQKEIRASIGAIGAQMHVNNLPDPIRSEIHAVENPTGNYIGYLGLGLLSALFNLSAMLLGVYAVSYPFRNKKIKVWLRLVNNSRLFLLIGMLVPGSILLCCEYSAVYVFTRTFVSSMTPLELLTDAIAQGMTVFTGVFFGMALVGFTGNMRMATSCAGVIGGPAFAFAGQTFPILAMPTIVKAYAFLLPLTHVLKVQSIMTFDSLGFNGAFDELIILFIKMLFWCLLGGFLLFRKLEKIRNA